MSRLNIGFLGCGPIAQAAHLESCTKAKNARLYAIYDVADDLRERMAWTHAPKKCFSDFDEMGEMVALKAWYCDSTHRYAMTDGVQPLIIKSATALKPDGHSKANLERYNMLAHGSHLLDTARYFAGELSRSRLACLSQRACTAGLSTSSSKVALSVIGKTYNPWYFRTSDVDIFRESDGTTYRPLGADGHFYRRQVEGFADAVMQIGIFAKAFPGTDPATVLAAARTAGFSTVHYNMVCSGLQPMPDVIDMAQASDVATFLRQQLRALDQ